MAAENHADWRISAWNAHDEIALVLAPALDHMNACLVRAKAGEAQMRLAGQWPAMVTELGTEGKKVIGDHDPRLTLVSEAQAQAGGAREVYGDKRAARY